MTKAASSRLIEAVGKWIKSIDTLPGWRAWQRKKIAAVLNVAEGIAPEAELEEFHFPEPLNKQHAAIMSYFDLHTSFEGLKQCEFYFRRYPFRGLPVTKQEHLRNICEMYFSRFYEFRERMKRCLNLVNCTLDSASALSVGLVIKEFDKEFDQELRARHRVHHHEAFDDLAFATISVASMMAQSEKVGLGWEIVANRSHRAASREWAQRVKRRSKHAEVYLEAVSELMLTNCPFLQESGKPAPQKA